MKNVVLYARSATSQEEVDRQFQIMQESLGLKSMSWAVIPTWALGLILIGLDYSKRSSVCKRAKLKPCWSNPLTVSVGQPKSWLAWLRCSAWS